jgi:hypothetical protein
MRPRVQIINEQSAADGRRCVPASPERAAIRLALSEEAFGVAEPAPWIGPLVALGKLVSRYAGQLSGRQLVVVISVPQRDFTAVLISCGWMLASPAPLLDPPLETMRQLTRGVPIRMVTEREVITDHFSELDERQGTPRLHLMRSRWQADKIRALAVLNNLEAAERQERPTCGSVGALARITESWDSRLCKPPQDLAIVGTLAWLGNDLGAFLTRDGNGPHVPTRLASFVLPTYQRAATWSTRLLAASKLADKLPLPTEIRAVVLDGSGATKYLAEIESQVVIVILDRSSTDETASEIVVQLRNTRGAHLSVRDDLGWPPPVGIEALAFTVPL